MSDNIIEELNSQFGIPGQLRFLMKSENFPIIEISNSLASATIALQGAHVMTWAPRKQRPVIWLSPVAKFAAGKSIRGGVPICWPWFGPHVSDSKLPGHGYARTVPWEVTATESLRNGATRVTLALIENDASRKQWPHNTPVEIQITVGTTLDLQLVTHNPGTADITLGDALHTYFNISDIRDVSIHGLGQCEYVDKVDGSKRKQQSGALTISNETDRVYLNSVADCLIDDPNWQRRIRISKRGSASTVVWNPWIEKANSMGDFGANGYLNMVCVESANALDDVVALKADSFHRLWVSYAVEPLG